MAEERQTKYTIMEGYELPSKGLIYDKPVDAHVELRSMTARDEMKRLSPSSTPFKTLADIIEGCMLEKPAIHVYDMAVADYEYLLHKLRIVTYGDEYKLGIRCPYCGNVIDNAFHLETLTIEPFDQEKFEKLRLVELPASGKRVKIRFQTPHMLDNIELETKELKRKHNSVELSWDMLVLLKSIVDEVDGVKYSDRDVENFILNLPARDMTKLVNSFDALNSSFGIDNNIILDCDKCGGEVHTSFRFGPEFFRPSNV